jgi:hypothetical protein
MRGVGVRAAARMPHALSWRMAIIDHLLDRIGRVIARRIARRPAPKAASDHVEARLQRTLRPGDVLLIDGGRAKLAAAIKYLTQSTWSHAALFVGDAVGRTSATGEPLVLVEAEVGVGVIASPLSKYAGHERRICRPVGLSATDCRALCAFAVAQIGDAYDMRNVVDLARYLWPYPPVPQRWRRRMLALGSGDPTRAICSTLIAEAFGTVRYPILPDIERIASPAGRHEILHIRHHSLYTPRDFDLSPYFAVVKPTLEEGFDYRALEWASDADPR